jgi:hypothetical protein
MVTATLHPSSISLLATTGSNQGIPGYEPGAGLGVLDVAKLAAAVAHDGRQSLDPSH